MDSCEFYYVLIYYFSGYIFYALGLFTELSSYYTYGIVTIYDHVWNVNVHPE